MALDKRYLEFHGAQWRVQVKVPKPLRTVIGKAKLVEGLHTDSLAKANKLRWPIVHKFKRLIGEAEKQIERGSSLWADRLVQEALQWRGDLKAANVDEDYADFDEHGRMTVSGETVLQSYISDRAEELSRDETPDRASMFHGIATGEATPLMLLVDQWIAEKLLKPRQKIDYRRAVAKFDAWLSSERKQAVVERVTRKAAGEYVSSRKQAGGDSSTINKDVSALSTYWRWLEGKGHVEDNVWSRQSLPKKKVPRGQGKRSFRVDEMKAFMAGEASALLKDAMRVAALTGMRVEEIARLKVEDCNNDIFHIHEAKTPAGEERIVPIHPSLRSVVSHRMAGKKPDAYLFHECPTPKPGSASERSQKISKQFTKLYRSGEGRLV